MNQISMNFGVIKDTVYRYASKSLISEAEGEITILNAFLNEIKKNPLLKLQFLIYKNFEQGFCKTENLAERFINQNLKLLEGHSWQEIVDLNKNIRYSLLEHAHVEGEDGQNKFYEAIHTLIKSNNQKGYTDISKSQDAYDFLVKHLTTPKPLNPNAGETITEEEYPKFLSWKFVTELAVNNFNERYSHLNEDERKLLKTLLSTEENKKNIFTDLKQESLDHIQNINSVDLSDDMKSTLQRFVDKINSLDENGIAGIELDEAIIHLTELKDIIFEIES